MIYKSDALRKAEERLAQKIREKEEEEKRKRNSVVYAPAENNSALKQAEMRMAEQINALETEKQRQRSAVYQPQEKSFDALRREAEQKTAQERLQKRQQKEQRGQREQRRQAGMAYSSTAEAVLPDHLAQQREENWRMARGQQQENEQGSTLRDVGSLLKSGIANATHWPARLAQNVGQGVREAEPRTEFGRKLQDMVVEGILDSDQARYISGGIEQGRQWNREAADVIESIDADTLGGKALRFGAQMTEMAPSLAHDAALATATAGASLVGNLLFSGAAQAGTLAGAAGRLAATAGQPVNIVRGLRYLNEEYENALANGADEGEALKSALLYALPSALIESSGGIDAVAREVASGQLRSGAGRFLRDLLTRTAIQEGGEEAAQTVLQNLAQGAAYDHERQLFSLTDESAVINPRSIAQSFLYGYAGGVLLGGVTGGADLALRRVRSGEARAALKSEVTRQAEAAGVQLTQAETEAMTDAVTAELMRELGETSNIETWNEAQLRAVRDMAERQRAQQQTTDNAGYTVDATGNIIRDRMQLPEDTGSTTQALLQAQAELDRFNRWRAENFGGAFGRVSDSDYTALKELYLEETGIDIDAAVEEAFSVLYPENVAWRRDPNAPQPGANVTAAALARMEGSAGNRGLQVRATGAPVSEETAAVLDRLDAGQAVSQDIISALTAGRTGTAGAGGGAGAGNVAAAAGEAGGAAAGAERIGRAGASDAGVFRPVNRRDSRPPRAVGDSEPAPHRTVAETLPGAAETGVRDAETLLSAVPEGAETRAGESWTGAQERIGAWIKKQGGPEEAKSRLLQTKGELTATEIGAAQELARYYAAQGDTSATADMVGVFLEGATDLGRALNYIKTLNRDTPEGFLLALERMIRRDGGEELSAADKADILLVQKWAQQGGRLDETDAAQASASLQKWLDKAAPYIERGEADPGLLAAAKAVNIAAGKQKSTFRQKFRTLQRISMLSNPKTHVRNVLGNAVMLAGEAISSPISMAADALLAKKTGQSTYSKDMLGALKAFGQGAKQGMQQAAMDYRLGIDTLGNRYQEGLRGNAPAFDAEGAKTAFGRAAAGFFNQIDDAIGFALSAGDAWALVGSYESAKQQMMRANGLSEPTAEIIDAAWAVAYRRTFRDSNAATRAMESVRNGLKLPGDIVAPYVRTPTNVVKVGLEYSPLGVVEAVGKAFFGKSSLKALLEQGESTLSLQREIAELFGRGMVGTGLMMLGILLGREGLISGDREENQKESFYQSAIGMLENSLLLGDAYYDVNFLQTAFVPLIAGAAAGSNLEDGEMDWAALLDAAARIGNTALSMPVLEGVAELLSGNYSKESLITGLIGLATDAMTNVLPARSLLRQTAAALDPYARSTAAPELEGAERLLAEMRNEIMYSIPGLRERLPMRYDTLGNPMMNDASETTAGRIFNAYLNPFNSSRLQETDVTRGIDELYAATQDRSVLPRSAPYDVAADGMRYDLSGEERQEFQRMQGQTSNDVLAAAFALDSFQDASPELQQDIVEAIYDYATDRAKDDFLTGRGVAYESAAWMEKTRELAEAGISEGEAIVYRKVFQDMEEDAQARGLSGKETNRGIRDYIKSLPLSEQEKEALDKAFVSDLTIIPQEYDVDYGSDESFLLTQMSSAAQEKWERARDWGMSAEEYSRYYPLAASSKKKAERIADLIAAGMSEEQAQYFYRLITSK